MVGKIFWILAHKEDTQITPLPPASHCPAQQPRAWEQAVTPCLGVLGHTAVLLCTPCLARDRSSEPKQHAPQRPSLGTQMLLQLICLSKSGRGIHLQPFLEPSGLLLRSLSDNSHVLKGNGKVFLFSTLRPRARNKVQISAQTWAHLKLFYSPICKMETMLLVDLQG